MFLLNFAHPLTADHLAAVERLTGEKPEVRDVACQFDPHQPFAPQVTALADAAGLTPEEWQTMPLLLNLPTLHVIAALLLAELHGRCGYFPAVLRLRPVEGAVPPRFEVAEVLDLQGQRERGRGTRGQRDHFTISPTHGLTHPPFRGKEKL